jgi:RNA polymerase sigma-70 factor (ECF subfamily)
MGIGLCAMATSDEATEDADRSTDKSTLLMVRYIAGDVEALNQLINLHEGDALCVVSRLIDNRQDAEDLVQEAWINLMHRADTFDTDRSFLPWFKTVVRNTCMDWFRRKKRRARLLPFSQSDGLTSKDDRVVDGYEHPCEVVPVQMEVHTLLADIVEKYRETVWQIDALGASTADVAVQAGRTEATVRWRLCEGRRMFRELLAEQRQVS